MESTKSKQGFAVMDRELVKAIARRGGIAAHAYGRAHKWTSEEAKLAGAKGGRANALKKLLDKSGKVCYTAVARPSDEVTTVMPANDVDEVEGSPS